MPILSWLCCLGFLNNRGPAVQLAMSQFTWLFNCQLLGIKMVSYLDFSCSRSLRKSVSSWFSLLIALSKFRDSQQFLQTHMCISEIKFQSLHSKEYDNNFYGNSNSNKNDHAVWVLIIFQVLNQMLYIHFLNSVLTKILWSTMYNRRRCFVFVPSSWHTAAKTIGHSEVLNVFCTIVRWPGIPK